MNTSEANTGHEACPLDAIVNPPCNEVLLMDCMEGMKQYPDRFFDIAIVDPPYGLLNKLVDGGSTRNAKFDNHRENVTWDIKPNEDYFIELYRVSKNQIIWGGNYFDLPPTRCNIIWDKVQNFTGSDFELAWTSFNKPSKAFRLSRVEAYNNGKIHPTQKPVKLYDWLIMNYAKDCETILDTHVGSGSSRIAAHKAGKSFVGFEIDKDYHEAQEKRFNDYKRQLSLF